MEHLPDNLTLEDENSWKWMKFVEIGNNINKLKGVVRIQLAKAALTFSHQLIENQYITDSIKRFQIFEKLLPKIAEYLDGNAEIIQTAVREYFLFHQDPSKSNDASKFNEFNVTFAPKKNGIQTGFTCNINYGTQTFRYYIKTHQYGPTDSNLKSIKPPDTKELFIYKVLHLIGIGPQVHFIVPLHGSKKTIYIATLECHLVLLSDLTKDTVNIDALIQLDLISRILCLRDCATNSSNCGQVGKKAMIVDFRIEKQSHGYAKANILEKFFNGNGEFQYSGLMETAVKYPPHVKIDVMKKSLQEWKLLESIEQAKLEIDELVQKYEGKIKFENDLHQYVQDLKSTFAVLLKA